jgi:hypothetical protein
MQAERPEYGDGAEACTLDDYNELVMQAHDINNNMSIVFNNFIDKSFEMVLYLVNT